MEIKLKEVKNESHIMDMKFSIKQFKYKRYPSTTDFKFTQEQVEEKVLEVFKEYFEANPRPDIFPEGVK